MRGRPKLSLLRIKIISESIRKKNSQEAACRHAKVAESSYYEWLKQGRIELERIEREGGTVRSERELQVALLLARDEALAEVESDLVAKIDKHSVKDPKAAMWLLEKRFPAQWGEVRRVELTGVDGGPIEIMPARQVIAERLAQTNRRIVEVVPNELPEALEG